jgi:UDP-glucose 4-epimerase
MVITMKALVTGGAGFVGSHLIQALLEKNFDVSCLDNFSTGKPDNLESFRNKITLLNGDIRNPDTVHLALTDVDYVFHLAAQISVSHSVRDPLYDASININGFINLLNGIRDSTVKRTIYVSTGGAIYGEPEQVPAAESTSEEPISPYGLSKLVGEKYLEWYHRVHGFSYSIIRPANIYGPRQDPLGEAGVISIFLGKLLKKQPLEIFGDGYDTRDYIYVQDIADICMKTMESKFNETFNAGTGIQTNLLELVEIIKKVTSLSTKVNFSPPRPGDVKHIALDYSKAKKILDWSPKTSLLDGITKTWEWYVESH